MARDDYVPLSTQEDDGDEQAVIQEQHLLSYKDDARFYEPPVPAWKRVALIIFMIFLVWVVYALRSAKPISQEGQIVHADRYSDKHKFRPAASPILRRRLPDGRIEVRGDHVAQGQRRHRSDEL